MTRKYLGRAGHFIASDSCLHHLHTHVNGYCVSTVGDYYPGHHRQGDDLGERETVGCGRFFETYVFRLTADGDDVESWSEIDSVASQTADEADAAHEAMCSRYEALT